MSRTFTICQSRLIFYSFSLHNQVKNVSKINEKSLLVVLYVVVSVRPSAQCSSPFRNLCHRHPACRIMSDILHMKLILLCGINKIVRSPDRYWPPLKVFQRSLRETADWWRPHKGFMRPMSKGLVLSPAVIPMFRRNNGPPVWFIMGICSEGMNSYSLKSHHIFWVTGSICFYSQSN